MRLQLTQRKLQLCTHECPFSFQTLGEGGPVRPALYHNTPLSPLLDQPAARPPAPVLLPSSRVPFGRLRRASATAPRAVCDLDAFASGAPRAASCCRADLRFDLVERITVSPPADALLYPHRTAASQQRSCLFRGSHLFVRPPPRPGPPIRGRRRTAAAPSVTRHLPSTTHHDARALGCSVRCDTGRRRIIARRNRARNRCRGGNKCMRAEANRTAFAVVTLCATVR